MSGGTSDDTREIAASARRIVVLRANGIGDLVMALPAIESLRAAFPAAEITLLGAPAHRGLADALIGVDRLEIVPPYPGVTVGEDRSVPPREYEPFLTSMRRRSFDLALQMHGGGRYSNRLVGELGARSTVGFRTPDAPSLDVNVPYVYFQHEVMRYLELVEVLGVRPTTWQPRIQPSADHIAESLASMPETRAPLVVIHPGNGAVRRRWPAERFARVGDEFAGRGAAVVVIGTREERDLAATVARGMRHRVRVCAGELTLGGVAGLLSRAAMLVASEGGVLHLGVAAGVPTVGIYSGPGFAMFAPFQRRHHRVQVSWRDTCPVCGAPPAPADHYWNGITNGCGHEVSWVADVSLEEVLDAATDLWDVESATHFGQPLTGSVDSPR